MKAIYDGHRKKCFDDGGYWTGGSRNDGARFCLPMLSDSLIYVGCEVS